MLIYRPITSTNLACVHVLFQYVAVHFQLSYFALHIIPFNPSSLFSWLMVALVSVLQTAVVSSDSPISAYLLFHVW